MGKVIKYIPYASDTRNLRIRCRVGIWQIFISFGSGRNKLVSRSTSRAGWNQFKTKKKCIILWARMREWVFKIPSFPPRYIHKRSTVGDPPVRLSNREDGCLRWIPFFISILYFYRQTCRALLNLRKKFHNTLKCVCAQ